MKLHRIIVTIATEDKVDDSVLVGLVQKTMSNLTLGKSMLEASVTGSDHRHVDHPDPENYTDREIDNWADRAEDEIFNLEGRWH